MRIRLLVTACAWVFAVIFGWWAAAAEPDLAAISNLHQKEAEAYTAYLDAKKQQPLQLQPDPIFKWQNLSNQGGQLGAIYVWTRDGRPQLLGTIFSQPEDGRRNVIHEFHTLAETVLNVDSPAGIARHWKPRGVLAMKPIEGSPAVAETVARRLLQMRALSREFLAYTQHEQDRIELRLAAKPLFQYQPTQGDVVDGAMFAMLSSAAGTDPEVILLIEARKVHPDAPELTWQVGIVRFTERNLVVSRNDKVLFSSIADRKLQVQIEDDWRWIHNADDTYAVFHAKFVPELNKGPAN